MNGKTLSGEFPGLPSGVVNIGGVSVGSGHPVRIQSMTNTNTRDVSATTAQCIRAFEAGADLMRISIPDRQSVEALKKIRKALHDAGFNQPLIADIHFKPSLAEAAAKIADKVRINPGNFISAAERDTLSSSTQQQSGHLESVSRHLRPLVSICKDHGTAIRIGTNAGSLPPHIISAYGYGAEALVNSANEYLGVFDALDFNNLIVSLKASDPLQTIYAHLLMAEGMLKSSRVYPMHIGVTEAGEGMSGRIRSALGIITLLQAGIGDTLRVSLTEDPVHEIRFAKKILSHLSTTLTETSNGQAYADKRHKREALLSCLKIKHRAERQAARCEKPAQHTDSDYGRAFVVASKEGLPEDVAKHVVEPLQAGSKQQVGKLSPGLENQDAAKILKGTCEASDIEKLMIALTADSGIPLLLGHINGLWISTPALPDASASAKVALQLLQATGRYFSETSFISCPGCARTTLDMEPIIKTLKKELSGFPELRIAVMGCLVNGPGEMKGADYGLLGTAKGKIHIFRGATPIQKNLEPEIATKTLEEIIRKRYKKTKE